MGLFNKFFKSKEIGFFQNIRDEIASEEKKKILLKSPLLKNQSLELNSDSLLSFVIAAFCFELDSNPKVSSSQLKQEFIDLINNEKDKRSFQLLYNSMKQLGSETQNSSTFHWNLTYTYLETIWGISEKIPDPILLTTYSMYITQCRVAIRKRFESSTHILFE